MATSVNPLGTIGNPADPKTKPAGPADQVADKNTFLKLLVAQIRNQDPLNPSDGLQFVSQLAQFTELEQVMGIRQEIQGLRQDISQPAPPAGTEPPPAGTEPPPAGPQPPPAGPQQ